MGSSGHDAPQFGQRQLHVKPVRCTCMCCPSCSKSEMVKRREQLRPYVTKWKRAVMLTLTVDRSLYSSPVEAYEEIGRGRRFGILMRELRRRQMVDGPGWFWAMECHNDCEGWPHFHAAVQSAFVCKYKLQDLWGIGNTWVSSDNSRSPRWKVSQRVRFESPMHAIHYVTKYIIKPESGFPDWVLDYPADKDLRRFRTSRGLVPRRDKRFQRDKRKAPIDRRTIRERLASCGEKTKVVESVEVVGGQRWRHVGTYSVPFSAKVAELDPNRAAAALSKMEREG